MRVIRDLMVYKLGLHVIVQGVNSLRGFGKRTSPSMEVASILFTQVPPTSLSISPPEDSCQIFFTPHVVFHRLPVTTSLQRYVRVS